MQHLYGTLFAPIAVVQKMYFFGAIWGKFSILIKQVLKVLDELSNHHSKYVKLYNQPIELFNFGAERFHSIR